MTKEVLRGKVYNSALSMMSCKLLARAAIMDTAGQTPALPALRPLDLALK